MNASPSPMLLLADSMPALGPLWQAGIVLGFAIVLFAVLFAVQRRTGDAGIVDVGWSYGVALGAIFCAATGSGSVVYRVVIGAMIGFWGLRLGTHILVDRVLSGHEDGRYQMAREKFGERIQSFLFWFYQAQAVTVPLLCLAPIAVAATTEPTLGPLAYARIGVYALAIGGEWVADRQLARFKKSPASKGADGRSRTCRVGLWRYSRHPNYFFEWLLWVAYALVASASSLWYLALVPVVVMYLLLTKVTGIPPTEARAVITRGEDYRQYQRTTSAFIPWFPRADPGPSERGSDGSDRDASHDNVSTKAGA